MTHDSFLENIKYVEPSKLKAKSDPKSFHFISMQKSNSLIAE